MPPAAQLAGPSRPGRPRLSRDLVLRTALSLLDADGLEVLSMRRLAQALECDPMALYRYAANRAELLDGITELVLDEVIIHQHGADWEAQLRQTGHDFRRAALRHPNAVPLLVTRPLSTPLGLRPLGMLRPLEQILGLLIQAGFAPRDALHVYRTYYGFLYGHILNELQEVIVDPEEDDALLRLGLYRLPPREFATLRRLAPDLVAYDGAAELDEGLDILLSGLAQRLDAAGPQPSSGEEAERP